MRVGGQGHPDRHLRQVLPRDRGQPAPAQRGGDHPVGPRRGERGQQLGVQPVAQHGPGRRGAAQAAFGPAVRQRVRQVVARAGEAGVDDVPHPVPLGGRDGGLVPRDDLVVLAVTGRDEQQGVHPGEVEGVRVVEVHPDVSGAVRGARGEPYVRPVRQPARDQGAESAGGAGDQKHGESFVVAPVGLIGWRGRDIVCRGVHGA